MVTHESRSARALSHAPSGTFARAAARLYFAFSADVARNSTLAVAGSGDLGRPRGRLGFSSIMGELCAVQIILDKPLSHRYSVRTFNQRADIMSKFIVVQRNRADGRDAVFAYRRKKEGPPKTLLSLGATAARMTAAEATALAAELSAAFPRWEWVVMPEGDFR